MTVPMPPAERALLGLDLVSRSLQQMIDYSMHSPQFEDALEAIKACPDQTLVFTSFVAMLLHHGKAVARVLDNGTTPADVARRFVADGYETIAGTIVDQSLRALLEEEA